MKSQATNSKNGGSIEVVVGCVVVNQAGEILVASGPKWKDWYTIPGGHIDYGEDMMSAMKRELKEEIGVEPERIEFLTIGEDIFPDDFHREVHFIYVNFVGWLGPGQEVKVAPEEFNRSLWVNPYDIADTPIKASARRVIDLYIKKYVTSRKEYQVVRVGVQALLVNDQQQILLVKRHNNFGHNTWGLPGGHLEIDESIEECAARELKEETGLIVNIKDVTVSCLASTRSSSDHHHIQIGVEVKNWQGEPIINEPEKCSAIQWWPLDKLPAELFLSSAPVIEKFKRGVFY